MQRHRLVLALSLIAVMGAAASQSSANVINAISGSSLDIQAAVNSAKTGDTVVIPAGTFLFSGQVFAPDGISIMGAGGRDQTFLIKNDDLSEWRAMITVDAKTGQPFKFSGITMQGRLDALQGTNRTTAVATVKDQGLLIKGAAKNIQIFDSRFTKFIRAGIEFQGNTGTVPGEQTGVIYRNEFIDNWYTNLGYGIAINGVISTWSRPQLLGTANALFIEDNLFDRNRHCVTSNNGANYVARYNNVKDNYQDAQSFDAHGLTPSWPRGARSVEIYGNTVTNSIKRYAGAGIRGGGGVIWGNTWNGVSHGVVVYLDTPPTSTPLTTYQALDQIGNPDGLYIWNNVSSGDTLYKNPATVPNGIDYWLLENRNYFLTAKPGYTPYTTLIRSVGAETTRRSKYERTWEALASLRKRFGIPNATAVRGTNALLRCLHRAASMGGSHGQRQRRSSSNRSITGREADLMPVAHTIMVRQPHERQSGGQAAARPVEDGTVAGAHVPAVKAAMRRPHAEPIPPKASKFSFSISKLQTRGRVAIHLADYCE